VAGNVTAALLLDRLTFCPLLADAEFNFTVHATVPDPVMATLLQ
jgi:hypothetical protein